MVWEHVTIHVLRSVENIGCLAFASASQPRRLNVLGPTHLSTSTLTMPPRNLFQLHRPTAVSHLQAHAPGGPPAMNSPLDPSAWLTPFLVQDSAEMLIPLRSSSCFLPPSIPFNSPVDLLWILVLLFWLLSNFCTLSLSLSLGDVLLDSNLISYSSSQTSQVHPS